ncbi:uncharacterized protein LOC124939076 [Impatiens glandulifera]|uniref:uncharacterized protein LOC124939076 n=1 Tax=Impatiens glandulifera TaxID=253017 RepID=UPI001FB1862E|nr:uncharacterized protein LOC124939076 [Impatiens glandulifera]
MARKKRLNTVDFPANGSTSCMSSSSNNSIHDASTFDVLHSDTQDSQPLKRVRRPTTLPDVWALPSDKRITVSFNHLNQPTGQEGCTLSFFLCTLVRNTEITPLLYNDWRCFPRELKDHLITLVKNRFDLHQMAEIWELKSLGRSLKGYRSDLKARYFGKYPLREDLLKNRRVGIPNIQWNFLVNFWYSDKNMRNSSINKRCREKQNMPHTSGSKSFARVASEMESVRLDHSRAHVFLETHKARKDGRPLNDNSSRAAICGSCDSSSDLLVLDVSSYMVNLLM